MRDVRERYIDVQAHYLPDFYRDAMRRAGMQKIDNWDIPAWSAESAIQMMDGYGIDAQLLSLSAPGVSFAQGQDARDMARKLNKFAAETVRAHSPRFGAFAALPLPDVDGALDELTYALDTLGLDGVALQSNYGGVYLGDPAFDAVFDELNRRGTVVFVHPASPPNFAVMSMGITAPILEYPFDTTRMATNLLRSGTIERCPDMRLIVAHGGGTIPFVYPRLALALGAERAKLMSSFYYDLTAATTHGQMAALAVIAQPDRLLMGFDFPFMNQAMNAPFVAALETNGLAPEARRAITRDNALHLFPRIAAALGSHRDTAVDARGQTDMAEGTDIGSKAASGGVLLRGATVVDTRTGKLNENVSIVVQGGKIQQILPHGVAPQQPLTEIDATGKFVLPGFLDMHTHLLQEEHRLRECGMLMLAYGITGTRQMAGDTELLRQRRSGTLPVDAYTPEILSLCGELLLPLNAPTPEAGVAEVRRQKAEGADFIKTIFVTPKTFFATLAEAKRLNLAYDGHLSPGVDVLKASRAGMKVIEHMGPLELMLIAASSRGWIINFILKMKPPKPPDLSPEAMKSAGRIMIANPILGRLTMDADALGKTQKLVGSFSDGKARKLAETFAAHGTWQCPTLIRNATMRGGDDPQYTQHADLQYIHPETQAFWNQVAGLFTQKVSTAGRDTLKRMGELETKLLQMFDHAGVPMMAGSDYGGGWVIPGVSLHQEFDLLEAAGLTPLKILQMTTLSGAQFLDRETDMGTVEEGKLADLVLLDGNPVESAQNLHRICGVVRNGAFYDAAELAAMKSRVAGHIEGEIPDAHDAADTIIP